MFDMLYKKLFEKHYLWADAREVSAINADLTSAFAVIAKLAKTFNIKVKGDVTHANVGMIHLAQEMIGINVPEPFYRGFPASVRELTSDQRLFDQLFSYFVTYGVGAFDEATHSIFEAQFARELLDEDTSAVEFTVLTYEEGIEKLKEIAEDLAKSSRPLSTEDIAFLICAADKLSWRPSRLASKNTAIKLILHTRDLSFTEFLDLSDVIKLVEELLHDSYGELVRYRYVTTTKYPKINKLNLKHTDRKFITTLIRQLAKRVSAEVLRTCEEKRKAWKGLLHHIHFTPFTPSEILFTGVIYKDYNTSTMHYYEHWLQSGDVTVAASTLLRDKGATSVQRHLNRLLSCAKTSDEIDHILDCAFSSSNNPISLTQLIFNYSTFDDHKCPRTFKFTRFNQLVTHTETCHEYVKRKSFMTNEMAQHIVKYAKERLGTILKGTLPGYVYLDKETSKWGVPIQESTAMGGYGSRARGSRTKIGDKTVRLFTYWEKVDDIDLSCIGVNRDGSTSEFSWRTFYREYSDAIAFSGDCTSGYKGGSEYIDVDLAKFKLLRPDMHYLIVCNNVYSGSTFKSCTCRAGYMLREKPDSGEVFEPKTVKTSYTIDCDSTFAYLFAIDLDTNEFVWLNVAHQSKAPIAGDTDVKLVISYIEAAKIFNVRELINMCADQFTEDPVLANIVITDDECIETSQSGDRIRSCDIDKILAILNGKYNS